MTNPVSTREGHASSAEPLAALVVGGAFGAVAFALCALWIGATAGIVLALAAAVLALARRAWMTATVFVTAAALSAVALIPSTIAVYLAAISFGEGLTRVARTPKPVARID
jgi:hypothetical protein